MVVKFTEIPDKLKYPPAIRAEISTLHSNIVEYVIDHYSGTFRDKNNITRAMNAWTYWFLENNSMPDVSGSMLIDDAPQIDDDICRKKLGDLYLMPKNINWNIEVTEEARPVMLNTAEPVVEIVQTVGNVVEPESVVFQPTSKEDLYIKPPVVPRFDTKSAWLRGLTDDGLDLVIYPSLPAIPTKQNEISITTDVTKMTSQDLRRLYPNVFIQTRSPIMYTPVPGLSYHKKLGVILPIEGFTEEQVIDNIIKYPHLFKLAKLIDGQIANFYSTIELNGQLHKVSDCWSKLPESEIIPFNTEFVKEYVVRRYLLERDLHNISHAFPMYGSLEPFLTLNATTEDYISWGYTDVEDLARKCVQARVSYKSSRNPIIRRLKHE